MSMDEIVDKVEELSGENIFDCYQCRMCSAGCPMAEEMDLLPNQVLHALQVKDPEVMSANSMWICASCYTCQVRCPKGVDLAKVMEAMRQIYLRKRMDHVSLDGLSHREIRRLPQIAVVASFRKKTG
ncbi:MAG TPA: heterodisulfide reductase [Candidatus Acetothermia bacterium]|nr:heterodisulfide reductase [Candidatus Acetothermia bacterium]